MKLTKAEEQGVRMMTALARSGGQGTLSGLAEVEGLTTGPAAKVLGSLVRAGLVRSIRGRAGRYELLERPEEVTVGEVVRAFSPELVEGCFNAEGGRCEAGCPRRANCGVRPVLRGLAAQLAAGLDRITVADLSGGESRARRAVAEGLATPPG